MQNSLRPPSPWRLTPPQLLVLGFLILILLGATLLMLPAAHQSGKPFSLIDALFTATSAVCVTGLMVVDAATQFTLFGQIVILVLVQAGGLGIMTLSLLLFLVMGKRVSLKDRLMMQEAMGFFTIAGVVRLTRTIVLVTLTIEAIGALLLAARWAFEVPPMKALYWGIFHSVMAFNNAGMDLTSASLIPYARDPFIVVVISGLLIMGGIGFFVLEDIWRARRWEKLSLHTRLVLKVTGLLLLVPTLLILFMEWNNPGTLGALPWYHKVTNSYFAAATARTAGFQTVNTGLMLDASLLLLIVLMFIGGSPGGTGGGIKTTTFAMIALQIKATVTGREQIELMNRRIPKDLVEKSVVIAAIAMALIVGLSGLLLLTESKSLNDPVNPVTFVKVVLESVSAFATVGLTTGITPDLSPLGRLLVSFTMFVGRVGPLTMAIALMQRKHERSPVAYPEDRVMIG